MVKGKGRPTTVFNYGFEFIAFSLPACLLHESGQHVLVGEARCCKEKDSPLQRSVDRHAHKVSRVRAERGRLPFPIRSN